MTRRAIIAAALGACLSAAPGWAQTPINQQGVFTPPPPPPGGAPGVAPARPGVPPAQSVVDQAYDHNEGLFADMARPAVGGQVQSAWDDAPGNAGVFTYRACADCTYKVRVREQMVTAIELPAGETIEAADVGDPAGFQVMVRGDRRLAVKPANFGTDTSLLVYGTSGAIYPFYLRAESFNSINVPDLLVRLVGEVGPDDGPTVRPSSAPAPELDALPLEEATEISETIDGLSAAKPDLVAGDFVTEVPFDPDALRGWGDYRLWGDEGLRPETVFRDDHFTYIQFGDRWDDVELPTAYVVVDGIDELVNTRVQGRTFIVESVNPLITLKSGTSFLCLEYEGADA